MEVQDPNFYSIPRPNYPVTGPLLDLGIKAQARGVPRESVVIEVSERTTGAFSKLEFGGEVCRHAGRFLLIVGADTPVTIRQKRSTKCFQISLDPGNRNGVRICAVQTEKKRRKKEQVTA